MCSICNSREDEFTRARKILLGYDVRKPTQGQVPSHEAPLLKSTAYSPALHARQLAKPLSQQETTDTAGNQLMTDLETLPGLGGFDPFADAKVDEVSGAAKDPSNYVHIRVQQRNGKKSLTTIQGLDAAFEPKKVLKAFKKEFCCNGNVVDDDASGQVIQLQGDQRKNVSTFLVSHKLAKKELIKIHGF